MRRVFHVSKSKHGRGVFAAVALSKGQPIYAVQSDRYKKITYQELLRKRITDNPLQISARKYLDWGAPGVLFNHSCEPSVGLLSYPDLVFVALRDIPKGEELRWDYSTSMDADTECDFVCSCGAKTCRKVIGGFARLKATLRRNYTKEFVVQSYLLDERSV